MHKHQRRRVKRVASPIMRQKNKKSAPRAFFYHEPKLEVTLDCLIRAIKGHFCSVLVSNIFCNPLFPSLPFANSSCSQYSLFFPSSTEVLFCWACAAKGEMLVDRSFGIDASHLNAATVLLKPFGIYIQRNTAVVILRTPFDFTQGCFYSHRSSSHGSASYR